MTAAMLAILVKVTVLLAVALIGVRLARNSRAAVRHVLLTAAFAALLILPMASAIAPSVAISVPASMQQVITSPDAGATVELAPAGSVSAAARTRSAPPRPSLPPLSAFLLGGWIAGTIVCLVPIANGLRQVRAFRRSGLPWREGRATVEALAAETHIGRRVDLLLHESVPGPMTCGVLHPAIVLPIDAPSWTAEDLRRAIVHEFEHVRRADWAGQCVARLVTACYWFHPVVWIAWRQLALEAERACDDAVLSRSEPTAYADQLVGLAQRLSASASQPLLSMANRSDLATRVLAVLDHRQSRGRAGALCVGSAAVLTVVLATGVSSIQIVSATGTSQAPASTSARPKYDVATIKPCVAEPTPTGARGTAGGTNATFSPGRFFVPCVTTEQLIYLAYASYGAREDERLINDDFGSASDSTKIRGGPDWVHSLRDKYTIEAAAAGATQRTVLMGAMLQSLLEDRFKLKLHRETEEASMMSLTVGPGGLKLKPMKDSDCDPNVAPSFDPAAPLRCGNLGMLAGEGGKTLWTFAAFPMSALAGQLSRTLRVHVIDNTKITDKFVFRFEFARGQDSFETEASVAAALDDQLGLKLTRTKGPRGFLVIDAVERPTPDGGRGGGERP
jgi:uncharacterized protein (TIGR03435 family)